MAERNRNRGPHGPGLGAIPDKPKDFKGTARKLLRYIAPFRIAIILVMIFAVGSTVFHVIGPKILGNATTELFKGLMAKLQGTGGIDYVALGRILTVLLMLYVISSLLSFLQGWIMTNLTQKMTYQMRKEIAEKINRMPLAYFESNQIGDIQSRITNDVDTLGSSLNQSITTFITSFVTLVGVLIMMFSISGVMTWISLIIIPVSAILVLIIVKHSQKYFKQQQDYLGKINGQIEETFSGHDVVTAFHQEENEIRSFEKTNHTLYTAGWKSQFLSGLMMPILNLVANIGYVAVAISGSILAARGTIQVGDIVSFVQYVKRFTQPITHGTVYTNDLLSLNQPYITLTCREGYASLNTAQYGQAHTAETNNVIRIKKTGGNNVEPFVQMETTFEHNYHDGFLRMYGNTWRFAEKYLDPYDDFPFVGRSYMYARIGIGRTRSSARWWNGRSWQSTQTYCRISIGNGPNTPDNNKEEFMFLQGA